MSVTSYSEFLCYERDLNKHKDKIINTIRQSENSKYKELQIRNALFKLLDAIDNHLPDSPEFAALYCDAKDLIEKAN